MKRTNHAFLWMTLLCLVLAGCAARSADPPAESSSPAPVVEEGTSGPADFGSSAIVEDVSIDSGRGYAIPSTITLPASGQDWPLVVLCHGFTGNRNGDGHFPRVARELADRGIACVAPDFAGNGESALPFTDYTLSGMYDDLESVIAYMRTAYPVSSETLGLVGHSMGGRVATLHLDERVTAVALWSPANNTGSDGFEFLSHTAEGREELLQRARTEGQVEVPSWGVTVSKTFLEEMDESDPCARLEAYDGPVLLAFAAGDSEVLSDDTVALVTRTLRSRDRSFVDMTGDFPDATHNYTALPDSGSSDAEVCRRIESATVGFLADALLTDADSH